MLHKPAIDGPLNAQRNASWAGQRCPRRPPRLAASTGRRLEEVIGGDGREKKTVCHAHRTACRIWAGCGWRFENYSVGNGLYCTITGGMLTSESFI